MNNNINNNDDAFSHFPILFVMLMEALHLIFPSLHCIGAGCACAQQPLVHCRLRCSLSRRSRPRFPASCLPPVPSPVYQPLCIRLMFKCCIVNWRGVALCWPARYLLVWSWGSGFNVLKRRRSFKLRPSYPQYTERGRKGEDGEGREGLTMDGEGDYGKYLAVSKGGRDNADPALPWWQRGLIFLVECHWWALPILSLAEIFFYSAWLPPSPPSLRHSFFPTTFVVCWLWWKCHCGASWFKFTGVLHKKPFFPSSLNCCFTTTSGASSANWLLSFSLH